MPKPDETDALSKESSRRAFLKQGLKGAALLPYVSPAIESIFLLTSSSDADADDNDSGGGIPPSQLGNNPPPPGNTNDNDDNNSNSDSDDGGGRSWGEPPSNS